MNTFNFTIHGNHESATGNPCPYFRVTGKALWLPGAKRYNAWKQHVRSIFYGAYPKLLFGRRLDERPLGTSPETKTRMDIKIFWANKLHADEDNIFKGIADALFENDKNLDGSFEAHYSPDKKGRVEVIIINDKQK